MSNLLRLAGLLIVLTGCAEQFDHDVDLARKGAIEFAEAAFVRRNMDKGHALLADKARSYVPLDKFTEKVKQMHRSGYPDKITALDAVPVKGEKLIHVRLRGQGSEGTFEYALTLSGTRDTGYRVTIFNGGNS
jgi:predicted ThiF/HesA family dinucleotide-utilizing enzyme